jgi:MFS family permease
MFLLSREFRLLWTGAALSTVGTWMQRVAQSWLVLTLTGSPFYLGLDALLGDLPILLFTLVGGVVADRHDRRYLLICSQWVQLACALTLAALVFFERIAIWQVLTLSFCTGLGQAFGGPAYQSLIPSLVTRDQLPKAIALNSIQFNLARVIGPLIAGVALATVGMAACFGLNAVSFLFVIGALLRLRPSIAPQSGERQALVAELRSGLTYVKSQGALVALIAAAALTTFLGLPLQTLLPVVAQQVFARGAGEYSRMMASLGIGAVAGALVVAWRGRFPHMGRALLVTLGIYGAIIVLFASSRQLWLSYGLLVAGGAAVIVTTSLATSLVQLIAPDHLRGRIMSIYMVAFRGGMPLGSFTSGVAASAVPATAVLLVNGLLLVGVAAWFLARYPKLRAL